MEQVALGIKTNHLASGAESGIDTHYPFLSEGRIHEQLPQILRKHIDGLQVGFFFAQGGKFRLDAGLQKSVVTVFNGLADQSLTFTVPVDIMPLQTSHTLLVVGFDFHPEHTFALATAHGQQPMTRASLERFLPIEVVTIFLCFVGVFLCLHHFAYDKGVAAELLANHVSGTFILADLFGNDVLCSM